MRETTWCDLRQIVKADVETFDILPVWIKNILGLPLGSNIF